MSARDKIVAAGQVLISQKGFSAVGLAQILKEAGVPKGSFYHFFASKDAFGTALLEEYFQGYHQMMDQLFAQPGLTHAERLMLYFANWRQNQGVNDCQGRCLTVKLGAEVSDFSESMRQALKDGTDGIIARLEAAIAAGIAEGTIHCSAPPAQVATNLYSLWIGASVMAKIARNPDSFDHSLISTRAMLGLNP
jgi:TetR/AcrR family transcriptional repressor of nem operon